MAFLLSINKLQCKDNCFFLHLQVNLSESYLWLGYFNPLPAALTHCPEGISLSRYILWFLSQRIGINDAAAVITALAAGGGELVVELSGVVHKPEVAVAGGAEVVAHFGGNIPKGIAAVFVLPAPHV